MTRIFAAIPVLATFIAGAGFFGPGVLGAAENGVVINEVLVGSAGAAKREFIELYNAGPAPVDLAGWTLKKKTASGSESTLVSAAKFSGTIAAGGYFLVSTPEYAAEFGADLAYSGSTYSIATNNTVLLYDSEGNLTDKLGWGATSDFEGAAASDPGADKSLARITDGQDSDNNTSDFSIIDPTPQAADISGGNGDNNGGGIGQGGEEDEGSDPGPSPATTSTVKKLYPFGAVLINEFVSDPADGEVEWIELANAWGAAVGMSAWTLEDGSGAKTPVNGTLDTVGPGKYLLIAKPKGNLNNKGDAIILRDAGGAAIDTVAYGDWADGNAADNAPAAGDPFSAGRCPDGVNSRNNRADLLVLANPTKAGANDCASLPDEEEDSPGLSIKAGASQPLPAGLVFSEALPNPEGDDAGEFIELYNSGSATADICGWRLGDATGKRYVLKAEKTDCRIAARSYLLVSRSDSGIALNNDKDSVRLFGPDGETALLSIDYSAARESLSYICLDEKGEELPACVWSQAPTPGAANKVAKANRVPKPDFALPEEALSGVGLAFDASDSIDEDKDNLFFWWDFGDGATSSRARTVHAYNRAGEFRVALSVGDGLATSTVKKTLAVAGFAAAIAGPSNGYEIVINEFMPDPDGSDDEEWIELYNRGGTRVSLLDWRLDDSEGGSRAFTVKDAVWIEAGAYCVFERVETGLALNNNTDAVRLFAPDGQGVDTVEYEGAKEGLSFARGASSQWAWSTDPTPGGANSIKVPNVKASAAKASYAKASAAKAGGSKAASAGIRTVALKDVRLLDAGDDVLVRGWASVLPGVLGSQYFYLHDSEGGAQVYSYKKDFPAFKIGDHIEAKGEIGISNGERRVKTKTKADIRVLAPAGACPEPAALKCEEIIEEAVGRLVTVAGEVSERKSSNVRLDDGTGEGAVYVKSATGINAGRFRPGDKAEVTGIVTLAADGARVLPRSNDDIKIARDTAANNVLGAVESSSEWTLPQRESRIGWYYGVVVIGFILSLIAWWVWQKYNHSCQK